MAPPTADLHGINPVFLSSNPSRWSVEEVYEFIASLQGEVKILSCDPGAWGDCALFLERKWCQWCLLLLNMFLNWGRS